MDHRRRRPVAIAFDVIETCFSLESLRPRLQALGLKNDDALELWFATMLRDAFALAAADRYRPFKDVAAGALAVTLADHGISTISENDRRLEDVLDGFAHLQAHPDVAPAFARVKEAGVRIVTLTNGSAANTKVLLENAGLAPFVEQVLSIEQVKAWKPRREVYLYAAHALQVRPGDLALVAAHAWDCQGAHAAGLVTGWVARGGEKLFQPAMEPPDISGTTLPEVCGGLLGLPT